MITAPVYYAQDHPNGSQLPIEIAEPVRLTVAPSVPSPIAMKVLPKATCVLHAEGARDAEHSLKLFADDEGTVRFNVHPSAESDQPARFQVDCEAAGQASRFPLELRPNLSPTAEMPAPSPEVPQSKPEALLRPALTVDDALHFSAEELATQQYPPRPDPQQAPDAFATWLKAVTKPATFVPPRLVANPGVRHLRRQVSAGFETTSNWSGFELRGPANSYWLVTGTWAVPSMLLWETNTTTYSAFWIGLDGDGTNDLVQDGTEQNMTDIQIQFLGIDFHFASYYAWTEFLPQQQTEQVLPGFAVNAGDEIFSMVFMSGTNAEFWIQDLTRNEFTIIPTARGSTFVGGSEAEWIMERPGVNGSLSDLADYGLAGMSSAYAKTPSSNWVAYNGANNQQIWMYNGSDLLSGVVPGPGNEIIYYWTNWH
jgi:hypothetical protein